MRRRPLRQRDADGMAALDRSGWADGIAFESFGLRVGVRVSDAEWLDRIRADCLPPHREPTLKAEVDRLYSFRVEPGGSGGPPRFRIHDGRRPLLETRDPGLALTRLESGIRWYVAENARGRVFVHAGAVGWKGRAIVLPGESFSGKTNLVAALIRAEQDLYPAADDGRAHLLFSTIEDSDQHRHLDRAMAMAAGLVLDAVADDDRVVAGQPVPVEVSAWNAGADTVRVDGGVVPSALWHVEGDPPTEMTLPPGGFRRGSVTVVPDTAAPVATHRSPTPESGS